jgi:hypothetical protein
VQRGKEQRKDLTQRRREAEEKRRRDKETKVQSSEILKILAIRVQISGICGNL